MDDYWSFWWEERIQANTDGEWYYFNPNCWSFEDDEGYLGDYKEVMSDEQLSGIKNTYANWALEKGLGL